MAGFASEVEGVSSACPATHHKTWKLLQRLFFHVYQYILRCQNTSTGVPSSLWGTELKMDVASGPEKPDEVGLNPSSDMCNVMM